MKSFHFGFIDSPVLNDNFTGTLMSIMLIVSTSSVKNIFRQFPTYFPTIFSNLNDFPFNQNELQAISIESFLRDVTQSIKCVHLRSRHSSHSLWLSLDWLPGSVVRSSKQFSRCFQSFIPIFHLINVTTLQKYRMKSAAHQNDCWFLKNDHLFTMLFPVISEKIHRKIKSDHQANKKKKAKKKECNQIDRIIGGKCFNWAIKDVPNKKRQTQKKKKPLKTLCQCEKWCVK